jgi:TM2 domain protein
MEYLTLKIKIMEQEKVNQLLMMMGSKIPSESLHSVREKLLDSDMNESDVFVLINSMKDPTISIILSILVGVLGVDRFYIGDIGLGVGKLLTGGGCYIWALVDIFLIMDATRQKNLELLLTHLR